MANPLPHQPPHLLRCFEAYSQIVLQFCAEQTYEPLQFALSQYPLRLLCLLPQYTFESVVNFHKAFVYARICEGQDDPQGWATINPRDRTQLFSPPPKGRVHEEV